MASKSTLYQTAVADSPEHEFDLPLASFFDSCRDRLMATDCNPDDYLGESNIKIFQQIIKNANVAMYAARAGGDITPHIQDVVNLAFILNELHAAE